MARSTLLATGALVAALAGGILAGSGSPTSGTSAKSATVRTAAAGPSHAASPAGASRGGTHGLQGGMPINDGALAASTSSTTSRTSATASTTSAARTHSLAVGFTALATAAGLCVYSLMRRLRSHKRAG